MNIDKAQVRSAVTLALRDGRLIRLPCERCGAEKGHAHHEDYRKPLSVTWLCGRCHVDRHLEIHHEIRAGRSKFWTERGLTTWGNSPSISNRPASPVAKRIIDKFGGAKSVASVTKRPLTTVYCWTYPRSKGGFGGLIPAAYQQQLLDHAREHGIDLTPDDFFLRPEDRENGDA